MVTATFRVEGTSPFSVDPQRMESVIVEMLAEKNVISQIVRSAPVEMKETLSCPPPVCRVPFGEPRKSVSGPTATRRQRRKVQHPKDTKCPTAVEAYVNGIEASTEILTQNNALAIEAPANKIEADPSILTLKRILATPAPATSVAATKATVHPVAKVRILAADENVLTQPEAQVNDIAQPKVTQENNPLLGTKIAKEILQIKVPEEEASELHKEEMLAQENEMLITNEGVHPTALLYVPLQLRNKIVWSLVEIGAADNFSSVKTVKRLQLPTQQL